MPKWKKAASSALSPPGSGSSPPKLKKQKVTAVRQSTCKPAKSLKTRKQWKALDEGYIEYEQEFHCNEPMLTAYLSFHTIAQFRAFQFSAPILNAYFTWQQHFPLGNFARAQSILMSEDQTTLSAWPVDINGIIKANPVNTKAPKKCKAGQIEPHNLLLTMLLNTIWKTYSQFLKLTPAER